MEERSSEALFPGYGLKSNLPSEQVTNQSIIAWTSKKNTSSPPFTKGRIFPFLAKRGRGDFHNMSFQL